MPTTCLHQWTSFSTHPTSGGLITYQRCHCCSALRIVQPAGHSRQDLDVVAIIDRTSTAAGIA